MAVPVLLYGPKAWVPTKKTETRFKNEVSEKNKVLHETGSVSYTHLDVYKRQV